jgi:hypothetical protein
LAQGNWVPWEAQAANNNPELLVWREEASCITTTVPGLYHLSLGFFTHSPVVIQVRPRIASHRIASHRIASHRMRACLLRLKSQKMKARGFHHLFNPMKDTNESFIRTHHRIHHACMHACNSIKLLN